MLRWSIPLAAALAFASPAYALPSLKIPTIGQSATEPVVAEVLESLAQIQARLDAMAPGDVRTANDLIRLMKPLEIKLSHAQDKRAASWKQAAEQYNKLNNDIPERANAPAAPAAAAAPSGAAAITPAKVNPDAAPLNASEEARWKRVDQRARSILVSIEQLDPTALQIADTRTFWDTKIADLHRELSSFSDPTHPKIAALADTTAQAEAALAAKQGTSNTGATELGDVQGHFQEVDHWVNTHPLPSPPQVPLTLEAVAAYTQVAPALRSTAQSHLEWLASIQGKTQVIPPRDIDRVQGSLSFAYGMMLDRSLSATQGNLDGWMEGYLGTVTHLDGIDLTNVDHVWALLQRGQREEYQAKLDEGLEAVKLVADFDKAMGRSGGPDRAAQKAKIEGGLSTLQSKYDKALAGFRMSEPVNDAALLSVARGFFSGTVLEHFPTERIIVSAGKLHNHEERDEWDSQDVLHHRVWDWDSFVVQSAEKTGENEYYVFQTLFAYYHQSPFDQLNAWLVENRAEGARILPENIKR